MNIKLIGFRFGFFLAFGLCSALLAFAYYLQYVEFQNPCPLCMAQRVAFYVMAGVFLLAALHAPKHWGRAVYGVLGFIVGGAGAGIAARQVWLQHLPAELVPACGPGIEYLLKKFPFTEVLTRVLQGSGECAEVGWRLFNLSIAEWSLAWLVGLACFSLYWGFKKH
jgi:disulfide bond formation protein DsbB